MEDPVGQPLNGIGSVTPETSEDKEHDQVLKDCEKFLRKSASERMNIAKRNLKASWELLKAKPKKNYKIQMEGIEISEIRRRQAAGECQRCAWPKNRKGSHKTSYCIREKKLDKGTASFPKQR